MPPASDPTAWQIASTAALLVAIVALVFEPSWAWPAIVVSGVCFAVEQVLRRRTR